MKKLFTALFTIGFILAITTAGASDIEAEIHQRILTSSQFNTQVLISLSLLFIGGIGTTIMSEKQNKKGVNHRGKIYPKKVPNYATVGNTYYTRTRTAHENPQERSAG